ncbi:ATP-binding protein [Rahnella laticis]|uniref:ATP-binding protein n=1 Tax=Rahnella laticis TaxID=2787622 RepID=UPI0018A2DDD0|nr:ATP-binding protein [Rahnella laticis]MBF7997092.1 AAA family ATPase [Rahnella laticis]
MINQIKMKNYGPLQDISWSSLSNINLIIGGNGTGKTFLLKALYSSMRTLEEYKRGQEQRSAADILADKLHWTFQQDKVGDLVTKGADSALSLNISVDERDFSYSFGSGTTKSITSIENHVAPRSTNSVFLPPKEVLSLQNIIIESREIRKEFGFDDTYYDLAKAISYGTSRGKNYEEFAKSRVNLEEILNGKVEYDDVKKTWQFKNKKNQKFQIGVTAEGIKKIAILDSLLGNRYLSPGSIIFIDEPESALHPTAISKLMDIISVLSKRGIQFFIASHSYFVIKKLYLIAQEKNESIPVISFSKDEWKYDDLKNCMPENPIIAESTALYVQEVEIKLG